MSRVRTLLALGISAGLVAASTAAVTSGSTASASSATATVAAAAAADGDRWSGPREISTAATRDAEDLVVDANPEGAFVAAWAVDSADDIAAVTRPPESPYRDPQVFEGDYADPDVALGPGGVGVLAWESGSTETTVYASSKASDTTQFTVPETFTGDGTDRPSDPTAQDPVVAVTNDGVGMLLFERDDYEPPQYSTLSEAIEGRVLLDPESNTWNAGTNVHGPIKDPRGTEASVGPDGSVFLATNNFSVGPCWDVGVMLFRPDGTGSAGDDIYVDCQGAKYRGLYPSNTRMPNGDVLMAYERTDLDAVYWIEFDDARAAGGDTNLEALEQRLDAADGSQRTNGSVLVRSDAAGNAVVVWYDSSTSQGSERSMLARFKPSGSMTWGPVEVITSGEQYRGSLDFDMDAAGNGFLVYDRVDPDTSDEELVVVQRTPGASGSWSAPEVLSEGLGSIDEPRVAAGQNGEAFAAWISTTSQAVYFAFVLPVADEPDPEPVDTTKPRLKLSGAKKQKNAKKVVVKAGCNELCTVQAKTVGKAVLKVRGTKKRKVRIKTSSPRKRVPANRSKGLALKFKGNKTKRVVRQALRRGKLTIRIRVVARDDAGNKRTATRNVVIKR